MKEILGISAAVLAITLLAVHVLADTAGVTANVDVPETCGLSVTAGVAAENAG